MMLFTLQFSFGATGEEKLVFRTSENSNVVDDFISVLQSKDSISVSKSIAYPSNYTSEQLSQDQQAIQNVFQVLFKKFGDIKEINITSDKGFYEVGATGGTIFWWTSSNNAVTKKYVYSVKFSKFGEGFVKIYSSSDKNSEKVVGFYYGLPINVQGSKIKAINAMQALLDGQGVPSNHPFRKQMKNDFPVNKAE
jgi:hypothetical protein